MAVLLFFLPLEQMFFLYRIEDFFAGITWRLYLRLPFSLPVLHRMLNLLESFLDTWLEMYQCFRNKFLSQL